MYRSKSIAGVVLACVMAIGVLYGQIADPDLLSGPRAFPQLAVPGVGKIKFIRLFSADQDVDKRKATLFTDAVAGEPDDTGGKTRQDTFPMALIFDWRSQGDLGLLALKTLVVARL